MCTVCGESFARRAGLEFHALSCGQVAARPDVWSFTELACSSGQGGAKRTRRDFECSQFHVSPSPLELAATNYLLFSPDGDVMSAMRGDGDRELARCDCLEATARAADAFSIGAAWMQQRYANGNVDLHVPFCEALSIEGVRKGALW